MAHFVRVETYPFEGFPDRVWTPHPEGGARRSMTPSSGRHAPVVELYSEAMGQLDMVGPRAWLMISVRIRSTARPTA